MASASYPRLRAASVPGDHPEVENFLATLRDGERESFLNFAELSGSNYEIWIYATILGFSGRFVELEQWVEATYTKVNRRDMLIAEARCLESDIADLRSMVQIGRMAPEVAAGRITGLTKELRGHLAEIEKMSRSTDRRGRVLAGADRAIRELKAIFRGNEEIMDALEPAFASVWSVITEEV